MLNFLPRPVRSQLGILRERIARPHVYVVSYPKSGRTWLQLMVSRIYQQLTRLPLENLLEQRHRQLHCPVTRKRLPFLRFGHGYRYKYFCQGASFPSWFYRGSRIVLLVRDPRDVLVSYYYYQRYQFNSYSGSLRDFVRVKVPNAAIEEHVARCGIEPILNYYNSWMNHSGRFRDMLILRYEDMHTDPESTLQQLLDFAGIAVPAESRAEAVEFASFERMRKMEVTQRIQWHALPGSTDQRGLKTRRGKVGGYRDELAPDDLCYVNRIIREMLTPRLGCYINESPDREWSEAKTPYSRSA